MSKSSESFVTISEASKTLGICANTLRSWGAGGKIQEYRHPISNYRLYRPEDITRLAAILKKPIKVSPTSRRKSDR